MHNTEGRFCETCITNFYRPTGKSMYDADVCSQCDCLLAGVQNMQTDCEKVSVQGSNFALANLLNASSYFQKVS